MEMALTHTISCQLAISVSHNEIVCDRDARFQLAKPAGIYPWWDCEIEWEMTVFRMENSYETLSIDYQAPIDKLWAGSEFNFLEMHDGN